MHTRLNGRLKGLKGSSLFVVVQKIERQFAHDYEKNSKLYYPLLYNHHLRFLVIRGCDDRGSSLRAGKEVMWLCGSVVWCACNNLKSYGVVEVVKVWSK